MTLQWHKRQAIQLATQLPDNTDDAILVIEALKELVETFLASSPEQETKPTAANVLPFKS